MPLGDAVTINPTFIVDRNSDLNRIAYSQMLRMNDQEKHNFWTRTGQVTRTGMDGQVETPIQHIENTDERATLFRCYIGGVYRGTPTVGADTPAGDDAQTIPMSIFEFQTVDMYAPSLAVPDSHKERRVSISIFGNYASQMRQFWAGTMENLITIYLCGMRGIGDNFAQVNELQPGTGAETGTKSSFTQFMTDLSKYNEITAPRRQFATWHTSFAAGQTLNASNAVAVPESGTNAGALDFTYINAMRAYLDTRSVDRDGIKFEKPYVRFGENMGNRRQEWPWIITPEIAREVRDLVGASGVVEWQNYQSSRTEGGMTSSSGFDNGMIGRIYGISFLEFDKLPRYLGGASSDVPIARTLILGQQALCYGYRNKEIPQQYQARFNRMRRRGEYYGTAFETWITPTNLGRSSAIQNKMEAGLKVVAYVVPETVHLASPTTIDKGRMAVDVPYRNLNGDATTTL